MTAKAKRLPSGWRVRTYIGTDPATRKRKYKSFTAETKEEAERIAAQYMAVVSKHWDISKMTPTDELLLVKYHAAPSNIRQAIDLILKIERK